MPDAPDVRPPGWYHAEGDVAGTQRYWDGGEWKGDPQPVPGEASRTIDGLDLAEPVARIAARLIDGVLWFVLLFAASASVVGGSVLHPDPDVTYSRQLLAVLLHYESEDVDHRVVAVHDESLGRRWPPAANRG